MAKQLTKEEKLEIVNYKKAHGISRTVVKYNVGKSTIMMWCKIAEENPDNLAWGKGPQTNGNYRRMKVRDLDDDDVIKNMTREELEDELRLHIAIKKHLAETTKEKFFAIDNLSIDFPIDFLCQYFKVTRQGYYSWLKDGKPKYKNWDDKLANEIKEMFWRFKSVYGYPMIAQMLSKYKNINVNKWVVYRYMKNMGLKAERKHKKPKYKASGPLRYPNILQRDFKSNSLNEKWVTDVTYIKTKNGMRYLSIVMDLYNKEIIDWKLSDSPNNDLSHKNLIDAWIKRGRPSGVIIHSDQGLPYTVERWKKICDQMEIIVSMSRRGNSNDNGACESWFGIFKTEFLYMHEPSHWNNNNLYNKIYDYIEFYNYVRPSLKQIKTPYEIRTEFCHNQSPLFL